MQISLATDDDIIMILYLSAMGIKPSPCPKGHRRVRALVVLFVDTPPPHLQFRLLTQTLDACV